MKMHRCTHSKSWNKTDNEQGTPFLPHTIKIPVLKLYKSLFAKLFKTSWESMFGKQRIF